VYAPRLSDLDQIAEVVTTVAVPVNVLALPNAPALSELAAVGVRRISTGSRLASAAYGALVAAARELQTDGTSNYAKDGLSTDALQEAFAAEV
jgi:2-methylisocitrate lyase-like PEP mutase family enzyme